MGSAPFGYLLLCSATRPCDFCLVMFSNKSIRCLVQRYNYCRESHIEEIQPVETGTTALRFSPTRLWEPPGAIDHELGGGLNGWEVTARKSRAAGGVEGAIAGLGLVYLLVDLAVLVVSGTSDTSGVPAFSVVNKHASRHRDKFHTITHTALIE